MAVKLFASVLIGSTVTEMKLYEVSARKGFHMIDHVSRRIDLGIDVKSRSFVLLTQIMLYLTMVLKLLAGFFANYIYYKQARRDITKIRAQGEDKQADDLNREIILAGGTSLGNVLLAYLIYTMISFGSIVLIGKLM